MYLWGKKRTPRGLGGLIRDRLGGSTCFQVSPDQPLPPPSSSGTSSWPGESHRRAGSLSELPGQAPTAAISAIPHTNQAPAVFGEPRERQPHLRRSRQGDLQSKQVKGAARHRLQEGGKRFGCKKVMDTIDTSRRGSPPAPDRSGTAPLRGS